jgi:hypothetical protein
MAKGIKGVAPSGVVKLRYSNPDEMPWEDIERQVKKTFDDHARLEIFRCRTAYEIHQGVESSRVQYDDAEELRCQIVNAAQTLLDVKERFRSTDGPRPSDRDEDLFLAVAFSSKHEGFDLTNLLRRITPLCKELTKGLQAKVGEDETSGTLPETVALAYFVAAVQRGASSKPARSKGMNGTAQAVELERWGVPVGIKSTEMAKFCQSVLGRSVTSGQVQSAIKLARQLGIL